MIAPIFLFIRLITAGPRPAVEAVRVPVETTFEACERAAEAVAADHPPGVWALECVQGDRTHEYRLRGRASVSVAPGSR